MHNYTINLLYARLQHFLCTLCTTKALSLYFTYACHFTYAYALSLLMTTKLCVYFSHDDNTFSVRYARLPTFSSRCTKVNTFKLLCAQEQEFHGSYRLLHAHLTVRPVYFNYMHKCNTFSWFFYAQLQTVSVRFMHDYNTVISLRTTETLEGNT